MDNNSLCEPQVACIEKYINKLEKTYIYHVNSKYNSRFIYDKQLIIHIIYLCFVQNYTTLLEQQLLLMKQYNFTYQDFNHTSNNRIDDYLKIIQKIMKQTNKNE